MLMLKIIEASELATLKSVEAVKTKFTEFRVLRKPQLGELLYKPGAKI